MICHASWFGFGEKNAMSEKLYVQYGCGWSAPDGWRNFDASPTLRFERLPFLGKLYTRNAVRFPANVEYGNIVKGLPIKDQSCRGVYCSHILEHLSLEDCRTALRNTRGILQDGGTFRLVVPDLEFCVRKYLNDASSDAAPNFLRETSLGKEKRNRGLKGIMIEWLGNSQHLWMWDYRAMARELKEAGFREIRHAEFGDSADAMFKEVEDIGRWKDCLGIECRR